MIPFNYHHLYYFYVIAQEGSISKATEQLRLAQPTLSAQLKQFENFLGVKLFIREKRKLVLTEEGHKVLSYAKMIFDIGQELKNRMVDLSEKGQPQIKIGISHYVPKTIVDVFLNFILTQNPHTFIQLEKDKMSTLVEQLNSHTIDIILTDTPFETKLGSDFQNQFIGKVPILFCVNTALAKKIKKFPQDVKNTPIILPSTPPQIFYQIKEFLYENKMKANIIGEIADIETVRRLALRGYGIAPINLLTIKEAPSNKKLIVLEQKCSIYEKVYLLTKERKQTLPLVEKILNEFNLDDIL